MNAITRSGRLAAWIALAAAVGVVVALAVLLWDGFLALLAALAALVVGAAAAWIALSRGGVARLVGIAVLVIALAGGAAALVLLGALDDLIVLSAAFAVFALAANAALRRAAHAGRSRRERARSASPGHGRVLLLNPKSGGGKVARFGLLDEARRRGIECVVLEPGDDLQALAREAARSAEAIGMAGGDGSQALVAHVAMEHDVGFVCVPAGTRNHLALDLGLDRNDVVGALDAFSDELERRVDLAFVNDRVFVNNVSLGVYAEIVQSPAYREAKLATAQELLPALLAKPFDLRFRAPDGAERTSAQLVLVSNNPYILDRMAGIGSRPRLDTGTLGIVAVEIADAASAARLVSLHAAGQVRRFEGWSQWTATTFEVGAATTIAAGVDGEALQLDPPLRFRIAPGALRVRLPATAPGLSPAALSPGITRSSVRALWEIAVGQRGRDS